MAKLVRVHDPMETERRIQVWLRRDDHPDLLDSLASLPYGIEGALIRSILDQWFRDHRAAGTLESTINGFAATRSISRRRVRPFVQQMPSTEATVAVRLPETQPTHLGVQPVVPTESVTQGNVSVSAGPVSGIPTSHITRPNGAEAEETVGWNDVALGQPEEPPKGDFSLAESIVRLDM